ncbi:tyrosine-type recombinase/integrase [Komagataeibacter sp. SM21]|uniref:tyrosine-type recombinase/integrase n=1 Tax=Komagataeibacter sp. SM21 TaxID=3242899 RepID=UPI0035270A29
MKKKSDSTRRFKVVKKRLADGSIKEYRYPVKSAGEGNSRLPAQGSVESVIRSYRQSIEFKQTRPATQKIKQYYLCELDIFRDMPIQDIKRRNILAIRDMIASCRGHGASNGFLSIVRSFFGWAVTRDWIEVNPASGIRMLPSKPLPTWTPEIVQQAMGSLNHALQRAIIMALFTGQRRSDLCRMKWSDISGNFIHVIQGKTGTALKIPIHPKLAIYLDQWRHSGEFILTNTNGDPWKPNSITSSLSEASLSGRIPPGFNIHGLRKMSATLLAEAGCTTHEIAAITGHKTLAMVQHYTIAASQEKLAKDAIARIDTSFLNQKETKP